MLSNALTELGLSSHETALYLTSIASGPTTIPTLAASLGVKRPNLYKIITQLENRGLAKFASTGQKLRTFMVEPPTVVRMLLEEKRNRIFKDEHQLLSVLPSLMAQYRQGEGPTKVKFFESREQWVNIFFDTLNEAEQIDWFGNYDEWLSFVGIENEQRWIEKRVEKKIPIRLLLLPSAEGEALSLEQKSAYRESRTLISPVTFGCSFQVFSNKVLIWQPKTPLAILVEDEYIARMFRAVYEMLWTTGEIIKI